MWRNRESVVKDPAQRLPNLSIAIELIDSVCAFAEGHAQAVSGGAWCPEGRRLESERDENSYTQHAKHRSVTLALAPRHVPEQQRRQRDPVCADNRRSGVLGATR